MPFRVNEEKCMGCQFCIGVCPEGIGQDEDGNMKVIDSDKIKACGVTNVCPQDAIEEYKE